MLFKKINYIRINISPYLTNFRLLESLGGDLLVLLIVFENPAFRKFRPVLTGVNPICYIRFKFLLSVRDGLILSYSLISLTPHNRWEIEWGTLRRFGIER